MLSLLSSANGLPVEKEKSNSKFTSRCPQRLLASGLMVRITSIFIKNIILMEQLNGFHYQISPGRANQSLTLVALLGDNSSLLQILKLSFEIYVTILLETLLALREIRL